MSNSFHWGLPGLNISRFIATANLHRLRNAGQLDATPVNIILQDLSRFPTCMEESSDKYHSRKLKFLDMLADIMARKKGGEWVACVAMQEQQQSVTFWLARNNGFLDTDTLFVQQLEVIMNNLATNVEVDESKQNLWDLIIHFYSESVRMYIESVRGLCNSPAALRADPDLVAAFTSNPHDISTGHLSQLITHAYHARKNPVSRLILLKELWSSLSCLAKVRDMFHIFKQIGRTCSKSNRLAAFRNIKFHLISKSNRHPPIQRWSLSETTRQISLRQAVVSSLTSNTVSTRRIPERFSQLQSKYESLCVHAEVQLIIATLLAGIIPEKELYSGYIACSKLCCFMCRVFMASFGIKSRQSHNKVYSRWTVPEIDGLSSEAIAKIKAAILNVQRIMEKLLDVNRPSGQHLPESPAVSPFHFDHSTLASSEGGEHIQENIEYPGIDMDHSVILCDQLLVETNVIEDNEQSSDSGTIRGSYEQIIAAPEAIVLPESDSSSSDSESFTKGVMDGPDQSDANSSSSWSLLDFPLEAENQGSCFSSMSESSFLSSYVDLENPPNWALDLHMEMNIVKAKLEMLEKKIQLLATINKAT